MAEEARAWTGIRPGWSFYRWVDGRWCDANDPCKGLSSDKSAWRPYQGDARLYPRLYREPSMQCSIQDRTGVAKAATCEETAAERKPMENKTRAWAAGPWFVCPDERNEAWRPGLTIGSVPNGARICDVFALAHADFGAANARLIAAAPDLYEALSEMVTRYDMSDAEAIEWRRRARAALAKAETPHIANEVNDK